MRFYYIIFVYDSYEGCGLFCVLYWWFVKLKEKKTVPKFNKELSTPKNEWDFEWQWY
jgi:hypothetical protein